MKHYAGLDVSVKETSVCIVDESGNVCREKKVITHPDDLVAVLSDPAFNIERVGLEAGPLSQWLFEGLAKAGFAVLCIETRHTTPEQTDIARFTEPELTLASKSLNDPDPRLVEFVRLLARHAAREFYGKLIEERRPKRS